MSSDSDESNEGVEALNKQRKKKVDVLLHYPGTPGSDLKHPEKPKQKKRNRKDLDVVGALSSKNAPFVVNVNINIVGVTTLSNKYKGEVTAFNN
jgi:hypothetical protein